MKRILMIILAMLISASSVFAAELRVVSWNMESGDASPYYLAKQIRKMHDVDLWGLSEVKDEQWAATFAKSAQNARGKAFKAILGSTGRADRLLIMFNVERFKLIKSYELDDINIGGTLRAPLVVDLLDNETGIEFSFVVNHLARGKTKPEPRRTQQAKMMKTWALNKNGPVVAVGDYNFDCELPDLTKCDQAYYEMVSGDVFDWVKPSNPIRTQCNRKYNSILDFVFVGNQARAWAPKSTILHSQYSMCDDNADKSDHRPVLGVLDIPDRR